jgi:soluble lytic murein transglycosylase-like protein
MADDRDSRQLANLRAAASNPLAQQAMLKRPGVFRPQLLGQGLKGQGDSEFESMMAVNKSQNSIIADVLDGPVSQQTQRQLAQLQAMNQKNPQLEALAESRSVKSAGQKAASGAIPLASEEKIQAPVRRGARSLLPGHTINTSAGTGKIFNTAQMAAYRQKYGYQLRLPAAGASLTQEAASYLDFEKREANDSMSGSAIDAVNAAVKKSRESLYPDSLRDDDDARASDRDQIEGIIRKVGGALGLDPNIIKAVVKAESNYNKRAVSPAGAQGLMQLMPKTAKEMGVKDPFDPLDNIWGGARYLKAMLDRHGGNLNKALAAYNWGPGNLDRHGYGNGHMPSETRRYIEAVNRNYRRYKNETQTAGTRRQLNFQSV